MFRNSVSQRLLPQRHRVCVTDVAKPRLKALCLSTTPNIIFGATVKDTLSKADDIFNFQCSQSKTTKKHSQRPHLEQLDTSAQQVGFFNIGSGWILNKIPGSGSGSGGVRVSKFTIGYFRVSFLLSGISGYFGYFQVCRVFSGIFGSNHIY